MSSSPPPRDGPPPAPCAPLPCSGRATRSPRRAIRPMPRAGRPGCRRRGMGGAPPGRRSGRRPRLPRRLRRLLPPARRGAAGRGRSHRARPSARGRPAALAARRARPRRPARRARSLPFLDWRGRRRRAARSTRCGRCAAAACIRATPLRAANGAISWSVGAAEPAGPCSDSDRGLSAEPIALMDAARRRATARRMQDYSGAVPPCSSNAPLRSP